MERKEREEMKSIIFTKGIHAILNGTKTQTRRIIKFHLNSMHYGKLLGDWGLSEVVKFENNVLYYEWQSAVDDSTSGTVKPRYQPGDIVYLKEVWAAGRRPHPIDGWRDGVEYKADMPFLKEHDDLDLYPVSPPDDICLDDYNRWQKAIYMSEWASRCKLKILSVTIERIDNITIEDCKKEGVVGCDCKQEMENQHNEYFCAFKKLWNEIYGPDSWKQNPYVFKYSFEKVEK